MADRSLSYYLGPHLSQGLQNAYNAGRGLLEFMSPGADVRDAVQSSQSAMQNLGQGNVGAGLLDLVYTPAALAGMFIPGSIGGTRRIGEAAVDEIIGLVDDVDPSMPRRLVNPEMRVFQGGPNKYGPDVPGTKAGLDSSKIGTGEGAQVYGHGHYLAENPNVAKNYAPRDFDLEEKLLAKYQAAEKRGDYEAMEVYERALMHDTPEEISKWLPDSGLGDAGKRANEEYRGLFADVKGGHLYEYDLPDETIAKMLDWDKPLSEQPQAVRDALESSDIPIVKYWVSKSKENPAYNGQDLLMRLAGEKSDHVAAAKALREAGIPGIKYLDQGSRGGGEGTRNFVLFDDDAAKLLARDDVRFDPDLPMDEASRMARAREMGFDTDVYHGTNENITAFDPEKSMEFGESWFSSSPKVANDFAMYRRTWPGANIMPAKIRGNFLEFDGGGKPIRTAEQSLERHLQVDLSGGAQMNYGETVGEYARRKGYDGIRFSNVTDDVPSSPNMGQPSDIYAVFDPKNIRSRFAKFDPSKKDSANILAGVGGGLLATGVLAEQRKKKDDMAAKKPKGKKK